MTNDNIPHAQHAVSTRASDIAQNKNRNAGKLTHDTDEANGTRHAMSAYWANEDRLLRRPEVEARTGLSRSTIYDWMKKGDFPQPVRLGARLVAWRESDLTAWLESCEQREVEPYWTEAEMEQRPWRGQRYRASGDEFRHCAVPLSRCCRIHWMLFLQTITRQRLLRRTTTSK